jgi:hypothetical protein
LLSIGLAQSATHILRSTRHTRTIPIEKPLGHSTRLRSTAFYPWCTRGATRTCLAPAWLLQAYAGCTMDKTLFVSFVQPPDALGVREAPPQAAWSLEELPRSGQPR